MEFVQTIHIHFTRLPLWLGGHCHSLCHFGNHFCDYFRWFIDRFSEQKGTKTNV